MVHGINQSFQTNKKNGEQREEDKNERRKKKEKEEEEKEWLVNLKYHNTYLVRVNLGILKVLHCKSFK